MKLILLEHHTSFEAAASILWNNIIYGGSYSAEWSHERRPHFFISCLPKTGNNFGAEEQIILRFDSSLRPKRCRNDRPIAGVVNTHRHTNNVFWQATILEGQMIRFLGATDLDGNNVDRSKGGATLTRLIELNTGRLVRTGCRQERSSKVQAGPDLVALFKIWLLSTPNKMAGQSAAGLHPTYQSPMPSEYE